MMACESSEWVYSRWSHLWFPEGGRWWRSHHFVCSGFIHAAKLLLKLLEIISLHNEELWNKSSHPGGPNVVCVTQMGCLMGLWEWWISSLRSSYSWYLRMTSCDVWQYVCFGVLNMTYHRNQPTISHFQLWKSEHKGSVLSSICAIRP